MQKASFYRPELDVVRFFAFFTVFVHHALASGRGMTGLPLVLVESCRFGLCLFFCLSAYLITLLLLREKDQTGRVHLRSFYQRRILRIWPLYCLGLLLGIAFLIYTHSARAHGAFFLLALVMLGNLDSTDGMIVGHLWSISIEEQFYVFWPTLMSRLTRRNMTRACAVLIIVANGWLAWYGHVRADMVLRVWCNSFVQFEMFAAGILLALTNEIPPPIFRLLAAPVGLASWVCAQVLFDRAETPFSLCAGYALVAVGCILLLIACRSLPRPAFAVYLGKISYGLYVFHIPMLFVVFHHRHDHVFLRVCAALGLTIGTAAVSYRFFESPFLRLKRRLEIIKTRPV